MKKLLFALFLLTNACQNDRCEVVLEQYLTKANVYCKGDTTNAPFLRQHLSRTAQMRMNDIAGLFEYSLYKTTRKGTLLKVEIEHINQIKTDSVICEVKLIYQDNSTQTFAQSMVFEEGKWCLGMSK